MKTLLIVLGTLLTATAGFAESVSKEVNQPSEAAQEVVGTYVGMFALNKITICLKQVVGKTLLGYSVVAGNERAFSGPFDWKDGVLVATAKEPGDHPEDGVFTFRYTPGSKHLLGSWTPNKKKNLEPKTFDLPRREFRYDPKLGEYPQSSQRVLKSKDVENTGQEELRIMRNEIYARHGYSFRVRDMRRYFDNQDWYMPIAVDVTAKLSETEKKNEALIKRYEKYAAEYYDEFGR